MPRGANYLLYDSEGKNRHGGSGQHLATWTRDAVADHRGLWWVRPAHLTGQDENLEYPALEFRNKTCTRAAQPVQCGHTIRLTNVETKRNLHSHTVQSPLSKQQEVSVFEGTDVGDNWKVECLTQKQADDGDVAIWRRGESVRLVHVVTGKYLAGSSDAEFNERTCGRNCPLMNHLEVFARDSRDSLADIQAEQGIYLHI